MDEFDFDAEAENEAFLVHKRRVITVILCLILAALVVAGVIIAYDKQLKDDGKIKEQAEIYNTQLLPLLEERSRLEHELSDIKKSSYYGKISNFSTALFLCTEPGEWVADDIKPLCDAYRFKCTVAVALDKYPGTGNMMSVEKLKELVDSGWKLCLSVQTVDQVKELQKLLEADGFDIPDTVYLPSGTKETSIDDFAAENINNIITHGDEKGNIVLSAHAIGCRESSVNTALQNAVNNCEPLVYTIGSLYTREAYTVSTINSIFLSVSAYRDNGSLVVSDMATARERRMKYEDLIGNEEKEKSEKCSEINKRLAEIEIKLSDYDEYDF